MTIKEMKESFVTENRLFSVKNRDVIPLSEELALKINCYAFAIGCLCPSETGEDYVPGFTENSPYESQEDLTQKVILDLTNLGRSFRKLSLFGPRDLKENEYLIKLFYTQPSKDMPCGDFHFLRQNKETKIWYHKPGFYNQPVVASIVNSSETILDPDELIFVDQETKKPYIYYPICYFAIEE